MKPKSNTIAVNAYRARRAAEGATTLFCVIDAKTTEDIQTIMYKRMCTKKDAIETAVQRYAVELTRKR